MKHTYFALILHIMSLICILKQLCISSYWYNVLHQFSWAKWQWASPILKSFLNYFMTSEVKSFCRNRRQRDNDCLLLLVAWLILHLCKGLGKGKGRVNLWMCVFPCILKTIVFSAYFSSISQKHSWAVTWNFRFQFASEVQCRTFACIISALISVVWSNLNQFLLSCSSCPEKNSLNISKLKKKRKKKPSRNMRDFVVVFAYSSSSNYGFLAHNCLGTWVLNISLIQTVRREEPFIC